DGTGIVYNDNGVAYADLGNTADNLAAYGSSYNSLTDLSGLRDVSGANNNLLLVNKYLGAVDQPFLRTVAPDFAAYVKPLANGDAGAFYADKTFGTSIVGNTDYTTNQANPGQSVVDYTPRMISQLVTTGGSKPLLDAHGQVVHWDAALYSAGTDTAYNTLIDSVSPGGAGLIEGATVISDYGILAGGQHDPQDPTNGEVFYGAINPGVAPGNSFLAYFGQFFDHGLDFVGKGAAGTKITIPLATDDPLYRAPVFDASGNMIDPGNTKITVSRADVSGFDASGNAQWVNHTSPYIDQGQTYGSHAQMTSLLREWVSTDGGVSYHAGAHLFDGATSAAWTNAWGETTKATLPTLGELNAHLIATGRDPLTWDDVLDLRNRDANGDVAVGAEAGTSGQALLLDMNPHFDTAHLSAATQSALALIGIAPDGNGNYALGGPNSLGTIINFATFGPMAGGTPQATELAKAVLFDSVSDHYIAGDGRANENIALTTIHHVFHEEHNFQVRNIQEAILAQDLRAVALGDTSHTIAHDWQVATAFTDAKGNYLLSASGAIAWDEGKLFDAAKLTVEMEYQHAAVDQYARTITPDIAEFVGYNSGENSTISLEYSQAAFRFGHSTMRETIDMLDPNGSITGKVMSVALEQAFLNPALFAEKGAASIALGLTHQQMNEIDELLTPAMNTGLLGQPLDLAAINIARGRDIGLPTLNDFREAIGLTRYISWSDFGANMVHPES
ncbi:MAG: peroxidase family protein, partial [Azonexus sp.]